MKREREREKKIEVALWLDSFLEGKKYVDSLINIFSFLASLHNRHLHRRVDMKIYVFIHPTLYVASNVFQLLIWFIFMYWKSSVSSILKEKWGLILVFTSFFCEIDINHAKSYGFVSKYVSFTNTYIYTYIIYIWNCQLVFDITIRFNLYFFAF